MQSHFSYWLLRRDLTTIWCDYREKEKKKEKEKPETLHLEKMIVWVARVTAPELTTFLSQCWWDVDKEVRAEVGNGNCLLV